VLPGGVLFGALLPGDGRTDGPALAVALIEGLGLGVVALDALGSVAAESLVSGWPDAIC
jgi:hypothetical protein